MNLVKTLTIIYKVGIRIIEFYIIENKLKKELER